MTWLLSLTPLSCSWPITAMRSPRGPECSSVWPPPFSSGPQSPTPPPCFLTPNISSSRISFSHSLDVPVHEHLRASVSFSQSPYSGLGSTPCPHSTPLASGRGALTHLQASLGRRGGGTGGGSAFTLRWFPPPHLLRAFLREAFPARLTGSDMSSYYSMFPAPSIFPTPLSWSRVAYRFLTCVLFPSLHENVSGLVL